MSILRARIAMLERRKERALCLIDKIDAQLDGLRSRETGIEVKAWQRRLKAGLASDYGNPRRLALRMEG